MSERADGSTLPSLPSLPGTTTPGASSAAFVGTFAALVGLIAVLLGVDLFLAGVDRRESAAHAADEYRAGVALLSAGRAREAAEHFATAVTVDRGSHAYALALVQAMLAEGRTADAEGRLQALLDRAGNDGATNLAMAHTLLRERREDEAKAYFHRAIFGRWGADSARRRADARFELIDLLARRGESRALLAELLPLEDTPPDSVALRTRLGLLFIRAGSPARAAALLREVLRRDPRDADAYAGMGEAALALGNFRTARADFAEARRLRPDDARLAARLALADTVLALDPTARGVGSHARYLRSRELLARTVAALVRCRGGGPDAALAPRFDGARAALLSPARPADEDAAGESLVALASDLWADRTAPCAADEALAVVFARLGP